MSDQHNHHCILTFMGFNWWIVSARPDTLEVARRVDQHSIITGFVDISHVNWEDYCKAAVEWDYDQSRASQSGVIQ